MKRLGPLIISLFVAVTAWAGDYPGNTTLPHYFSPGEYEEIMRQIHESAPSTEGELSTKDIADILQRCLEFLRDGDANYLENIPTCTTLLCVPPYRTLKNDAEDEVAQAEIAKGKLERETALRREIENAIQILKGEK